MFESESRLCCSVGLSQGHVFLKIATIFSSAGEQMSSVLKIWLSSSVVKSHERELFFPEALRQSWRPAVLMVGIKAWLTCYKTSGGKIWNTRDLITSTITVDCHCTSTMTLPKPFNVPHVGDDSVQVGLSGIQSSFFLVRLKKLLCRTRTKSSYHVSTTWSLCNSMY